MSLSAPVRDEMLLPCPFCGGEGYVFENPWTRGEWEAQCHSCEAGPSFRNSEAEATAAWNIRTPASQVEAGEVERLNDWLAETQMLAHKWMVAHDRLKADEPYDLPKPADLPDAIIALLEERDTLQASLEAARLSVTTPDTTVLEALRELLRYFDDAGLHIGAVGGQRKAVADARELLRALASTANPTGETR